MLPDTILITDEIPAILEADAESASVLVVDDSKLNRHVLSDLLRDEGHRVTAVSDAREALELIGKRDFDLVLLDVVLPDIDGMHVLARMRRDRRLREIPVIMITGLAELESAARCIQMGAEDYLFKPFDPVLLRARIGASLEKRRLRAMERAYLARLGRDNRRKSEEIEQARLIQDALLPGIAPPCGFLEVTSRQLAATEVGGDYYDFHSHGDDHLGCAIGDATGHGVGAGTMVAITKALLISAVRAAEDGGLEDVASPRRNRLPGVVSHLNDSIYKTGLGEQSNMALMLFDFFRDERGVHVRASGGAMPPVYILRACGGLDSVEIWGAPLGITKSANLEYDDIAFFLNPGDTAVLMSDGLPEVVNPLDVMLDYARLEERLGHIDPAKSAGEILEAVWQIGAGWAEGVALRDDMTVVVLKAS